MGTLLLHAGWLLSILSIVAAVAVFIITQRKKSALEKQLDEEYGEKKRG